MSKHEHKQWQSWMDAVQASPEYAAEDVKLDFALALERRMAQLGVSRADLARKLGTSAAAITNTLRGDANLSIERMVRLAHALESVLHVHVAPVASKVRWLEVHDGASTVRCDQISHGSIWARHLKGADSERRATANTA